MEVTRNTCSNQDTIEIGSQSDYLTLTENDTTICRGRFITLHAHTDPENSLLWSTGDTGPEITVGQDGIYRVSSSGACGNLSDSIRIETMSCDCLPWVPNAFSPNDDGRNDLLEVRIGCTVFRNYRLAIYNRFGQKVFESYDAAKGWDGKMHNIPADAGTYFYRLSLNQADGSSIQAKGDIMLLR